MDNYMLHVQESVNLTIYLYAQTMGHRRMLYIRKFYVVKHEYISITKREIFFLLSIFTGGTQGHNYKGDAGGTGGYINDDGDTGNVRLAITINKAQGKSLE